MADSFNLEEVGGSSEVPGDEPSTTGPEASSSFYATGYLQDAFWTPDVFLHPAGNNECNKGAGEDEADEENEDDPVVKACSDEALEDVANATNTRHLSHHDNDQKAGSSASSKSKSSKTSGPKNPKQPIDNFRSLDKTTYRSRRFDKASGSPKPKSRGQENTGVGRSLAPKHLKPKHTSHDVNPQYTPTKRDDEQPAQQMKHQSHDDPNRSPQIKATELWFGCDIPQVVEEMRNASEEKDSTTFDLLSNFVVINGSPKGFECTTCISYLTRRWERVGLPILSQLSHCIDLELLGDKRDQVPVSRSLPISISIRDEGVCLSYEVIEGDTDYEVVDSYVTAFMWLCTAIRHNPNMDSNKSSTKSIYLSTMGKETESIGNIKSRKVSHVAVSPQSLQDLVVRDSICWLQMFESVTISWQPENPVFSERRLPGLEIPFDMMVHLASAERFHPIDGGIVLLGFFTALIPMQRHANSNTIQWHFENVGDDEMIRPSKLNAIQKNWQVILILFFIIPRH
ncbi:hypothetical protein PG995_012162 [Apiospora arundinis]